jgi:hypothetical protein
MNNITIKHSQEEVLSWSRVVRFDWVAPGSDRPELVVIKFYHSDFEGYEIDWRSSDYPQSFKDLVDSDNDLAELLDQMTWDFNNNTQVANS